MKIRVEPERCQGHGLCRLAAPEVFGQDEQEGHVVILQPEVPPELEAAARAGVDGCPERALRIE